jgi:hypothetical protein
MHECGSGDEIKLHGEPYESEAGILRIEEGTRGGSTRALRKKDEIFQKSGRRRRKEEEEEEEA